MSHVQYIKNVPSEINLSYYFGTSPLFLFSFHMVFWGPFWHSVDSSVGRDEACTNFAQLRRIKNGGVDIILGRSNMLNMQVALNFPPNIFIYIALYIHTTYTRPT